MIHSHVKYRRESDLQPEFPNLLKHEKLKYAHDTFQSSHLPIKRLQIQKINSDGIVFNVNETQTKYHQDIRFNSVSSREEILDFISKYKFKTGIEQNNEGQILIINNEEKPVLETIFSSIEHEKILCVDMSPDTINQETIPSILTYEEGMIIKIVSNITTNSTLNTLCESLKAESFSLVVVSLVNKVGLKNDIESISKVLNSKQPDALLVVINERIEMESIEMDKWNVDIFINSTNLNFKACDTNLSAIYLSDKAQNCLIKDSELCKYVNEFNNNTDNVHTPVYEIVKKLSNKNKNKSFNYDELHYRSSTKKIYQTLQKYLVPITEDEKLWVSGFCSFYITDSKIINNLSNVSDLINFEIVQIDDGPICMVVNFTELISNNDELSNGMESVISKFEETLSE